MIWYRHVSPVLVTFCATAAASGSAICTGRPTDAAFVWPVPKEYRQVGLSNNNNNGHPSLRESNGVPRLARSSTGIGGSFGLMNQNRRQSRSHASAAATAFSASSSDDELCTPLPPPRWICPEHMDVCTETGVTLSRYMMEMARANPELDEVESIFTSIETATKTISSLVRRSYLRGVTGAEGGGGSINVQGEEQKKLDVISNNVLKRALKWTGKLGTLASEEEDAPVLVDNRGNQVYSGDVLVEQEGRYVAVFDPLDGSSNVDAGIPVGTIFGIFKNDDECMIADEDPEQLLDDYEKVCLQNTLQPGKNLVAAGYCLYSSATTLMFTLGCGVNGFTLDETIGEYVLTHPNVVIPRRGKIYSFNEANRWDWDQPLQDYITDIQQGRGDTKQKYSARYIGSMVADVHRTLLYGGVFGYPSDKKNLDGKLRLLYEAAPMSFLVEQAGGLALTGKNRILDIVPHSVHQRVPCILGSPDDVAELRRYYDASNDPDIIARCEARMKGMKIPAAAAAVAAATTTTPQPAAAEAAPMS